MLELLVGGVTSNRKLAQRLGVSENTVKFHVRNILDKLHLHNRTQVVGFALRHGMVPPHGEAVRIAEEKGFHESRRTLQIPARSTTPKA